VKVPKRNSVSTGTFVIAVLGTNPKPLWWEISILQGQEPLYGPVVG
jgi:hypothetical protein